MHNLILPGDPMFDLTLATPCPDWRQVAAKENFYSFIYDRSLGIFRTIGNDDELEEYLEEEEYYQELDDGELEEFSSI